MAKSPVKTINLALQGGGAHGAFAWGVLDRLLEDERIAIEGVCATSAGTMNALALGYGLHRGAKSADPRAEARAMLETFWNEISRAGQVFSPLRVAPWSPFAVESSPAWLMFDGLTRMTSPYQWNPFDVNPLRDVLARCIDFDELRCCSALKLFISATNVKTGKVRVFEAPDLTIDVALASACLPFLFKAVEIGEEAFWDGGYMGNPALFPLFYRTESRDVMIVHVNPIERDEVPTSAPDIMNRVNEISFNASLLKEMRAIAFVKKLIEHDMLKKGYERHFKNVLVHSLRADEAMDEFSVATKFDTSWGFLTGLRDRGRAAMDSWLAQHFEALNVHDTVDLHDEFLGSVSAIFGHPGDMLP